MQHHGADARWWVMETVLADGPGEEVAMAVDFDAWVAARGPALLRLA